MTVALIDNGSLEPAAHRNLRALAAALSERSGVTVHAVSWKHSDRIPAEQLEGTRAWTLARYVRARFERGEREFLFVPFFISPQGAIGSALRGDLERLQQELGAFTFAFTAGLAGRGALVPILIARIRETITALSTAAALPRPVVIVDHGGPSVLSAVLRDEVALQVKSQLGADVGPLAPASMEGVHGPLLADQLRAPAFRDHEVIVAPLFLAPGRHAGPAGDIARICTEAGARCHLTGLVGTHPLALAALAGALHDALLPFHAQTSA